MLAISQSFFLFCAFDNHQKQQKEYFLRYIRSPNENSTSKNIPQKKKRDVFNLIMSTYRHHAGEGRRGERQRGVRRLFRFFERVSFLGGHFVFGGYIYRSRENS